MIRRLMAGFMVGRYGGDQLNIFLLTLYVILYIVNLFTRWPFLDIVVLVLLAFTLYRSLSRNLERRRAENAKFLQLVRPLSRWWNTLHSRAHDREHRYFKCPNCGQQMRVPRGKGRIVVHCRSCGAAFEEKS